MLARALMALGLVAFLGAGAALLWAPHVTGLQPTVHVYPATVWILCIWTAIHAGVGALMLAYCLARSFAGKLTGRYDIDLSNVALYTHFAAATGLVTVLTVGWFPLVAGG